MTSSNSSSNSPPDPHSEPQSSNAPASGSGDGANSAAAAVQAQPLTLTTADGYRIAATRYDGSQPSHAQLLVAGATGVPAGFYRRFAEFAAARGYATMTLDYRGIGRSAPATLKGFRMNLLDWARQDLAAAVQAHNDPAKPLFLVGHSYGGHAVGLLPNADRIAGCYIFGTGAGWHGWMPPLERLRVLALWRVLGPPWTRWKGYLPWSRLGMGEDLPLDVYRQWKRWCSYPHYFFDDPAMPGIRAEFDRIRAPIIALNATDDRWAPPRSRDAFMAGYRNSPWRGIDLDPAAIELQTIGHMGYFRASAAPLWHDALAWFDSLHPCTEPPSIAAAQPV